MFYIFRKDQKHFHSFQKNFILTQWDNFTLYSANILSFFSIDVKAVDEGNESLKGF